MSGNRNHHFVPRFYLRGFSRDGGSIRLINLSKKRFVPQASISGQCYRVGFHDFDPGLEDRFGVLEDATAPIFQKIIADNMLPPLESDDHATIAFFLALQKVRTAKSTDTHGAMDEILFSALYEDELGRADTERARQLSGNRNPFAIAIKVAADQFYLLAELGFHLFVNETKEDFITSDNPVVVHNQYCQTVKSRGVLGWNSSGIQMMLPLSPRHMLFLYDVDVYKISAGKHGNTKKITDLADVKNINAFQILNAERNIYFQDKTMAGMLLWHIEQLADKRNIKRNIIVQTEQVESGGESSEIFHEYEQVVPLSMHISSVRVRNGLGQIPLGRRASMPRTQMLHGNEYARPRSSSVSWPVRRTFAV